LGNGDGTFQPPVTYAAGTDVHVEQLRNGPGTSSRFHDPLGIAR